MEYYRDSDATMRPTTDAQYRVMQDTGSLALDEYAKLLSDAIARTRSTRRRVSDAADKLFGSMPENATAQGQATEMTIGGLIREMNDELNALEYQVGRL